MSKTAIRERQQDQVRRLAELADKLTMQLASCRQQTLQQLEENRRSHARRQHQLESQMSQELNRLNHEYTTHLEAARVRLERQVELLEQQRGERSDVLTRDRAESIKHANALCEETEFRLRDEYRADTKRLEEHQQQLKARCGYAQQQFNALQQAAVAHLGQRGVGLGELPEVEIDGNAWSSQLWRQHEAAMLAVGEALTASRRTSASRFMADGWTVLIAIAFLTGGTPFWGYVLGWQPLPWGGAVIASTLLGTFGLHLLMHRITAAQYRRLAPQLAEELALAKSALILTAKVGKREHEQSLEELEREHERQRHEASSERDRTKQEAEGTYRLLTSQLEASFQGSVKTAQSAWEEQTEAIRQRYLPKIKQRQDELVQQQNALRVAFETRQDQIETLQESETQKIKDQWRQALQDFSDFVQQIHETCPPLQTLTDVQAWHQPERPPQAIPLGSYRFDLPPSAHELVEIGSVPELPALLSFPDHASLVLRASGAGREAAVKVLYNAALRMLAAFPPGKVRFTLFDPVGLGQEFSALMHLADFDERLVNHRIWTEAAQLNQRLADLTEHMENVIQKYLRNEYRSIQEYNEQAGEVAEPFRVLLIANFPQQFSDEAIRRLVSLAQSGPRCGVFTLISVDTSAKLPKSLRMEDLEAQAHVFQWEEDHFVSCQEPFSELPLEFDAPPQVDVSTALVKAIGRHAQDAQRVQVPFSTVVPGPADCWSVDAAHELVVPLGRAGATKLQELRLGRGTSQHVLISGKTGSGKSTLLNALVTNAALRYAPTELEFYLIDFKKGVEFKAYADVQLPHARVIAIESEREFGLSVLQRLDEELRERGDRFRAVGVQSLAAFREKCPAEAMPRVLLIVDEFQEFFVNDDKVSHEASLLLDRLVRQGRAFGMHVILGSQTLAGTYSLARSTLGQMAVRIALQCSASDAHLILSEDNTAARLLSRPGEAIYNDANGVVEGNHPFQVVWLPDEERNAYLAPLRDLVRDHQLVLPPTIVFEGHAAADLATNAPLGELLDHPMGGGDTVPAPRAWLGAAVAIKEPTSVTFKRQGGSHLLIVGQNEELAAGIIASSLISLVAVDGAAREPAQFTVLDGGRSEGPKTELGDRLKASLPADLHVVGPAEVRQVIHQTYQELESRLANPSDWRPARYLFIFDLARFRDLQVSADDFGLGSFSSGPAESPSAQFARILRDGPAVGIHLLIWADCYHTLSRWIERSSLRDLSQRVLFQMSAVDSSHLMDSARASQVGAYRGILYDHDRGTEEKFRPYAVPTNEWLEQVQQRLTQRIGEDEPISPTR